MPLDDAPRYTPPTARDHAQHATAAGPWWQHRAPQTDEERLELAALQFQPDAGWERELVLAERWPKVYQLLTKDEQLRVDHYRARREAKVALGGWSPPDPATIIEELEPLVAELEAAWSSPPANPQQVDRDHRRRFREVVESGTGGEIIEAWRDWALAVAAANRDLARYLGAHEALGVRLARHVGAKARLPILADELQLAVGGNRVTSGGIVRGDEMAPTPGTQRG